MKILNKTQNWSSKVNFIDKNNVFLGYDLFQNCCEHADWFIDDKICEEYPEKLNHSDEGLENYYFDVNFFESVGNARQFDEGAMAIFRITDGQNEKFIHIFNSHNGYYSHGFEFNNGKDIIKEDYL